MSGLERSVTSYRRQGSSGLVWHGKLMVASCSRDLNQTTAFDSKQDMGKIEQGEVRMGMMGRSLSTGTHHPFLTASPLSNKDPPSPKTATCGLFCGMFGQPAGAKPKSRKRM